MGKATAKKRNNVPQSSWHESLIRYLTSHYMACKLSLRNLLSSPLTTFLSIFAMGVCLSLPMSLYLFVKNISHLSQGFDQGSAITLYLNPDASEREVDAILQKIKAYPFVKKATFLGPEKTLAEFEAASGLRDTLALLGENPLPGVITMELAPKETSQAELLMMKNTLAKMSSVKSAAFDYDWLDKLAVFLSFGKTLSRALYLLIGLGVTLMVGNTIRLALERHREEMDVLNLVGATKAFIRRPFLYRGMLYGALGGIIALLVTYCAVLTLSTPTKQLVSLYQGIFTLENLTFYDTVAFLAASILLGWLGAVVAFMQQRRSLNEY
ncbi:MAG: permease-like cell division protein FtsX [Candidatus Berkiella sp.]